MCATCTPTSARAVLFGPMPPVPQPPPEPHEDLDFEATWCYPVEECLPAPRARARQRSPGPLGVRATDVLAEQRCESASSKACAAPDNRALEKGSGAESRELRRLNTFVDCCDPGAENHNTQALASWPASGIEPPRGVRSLEDLSHEVSKLARAHSSSTVVVGVDDLVFLHVYDINYLTRLSSLPFYHVGLEVYGKEFFFGTRGVQSCRPGHHKVHIYRDTVHVGQTALSPLEVSEVLYQLRREWLPETYSLLGRNCQSFIVTLCELLGLFNSIPPQYRRFSELHGLRSVVCQGGLLRDAASQILRPAIGSCSDAPSALCCGAAGRAATREDGSPGGEASGRPREDPTWLPVPAEGRLSGLRHSSAALGSAPGRSTTA